MVAFLTANSQQIFGTSIISLGVDVNIQACIATEQTARRAITDEGSKSCYLGSINADLCSNVQSKAVDILVFNPPYVPSEVLPQLPNTASKPRTPSFRTRRLYDSMKENMMRLQTKI